MTDLHACHVLVVEDEYLLAQEMQSELEIEGAVVVGPEGSVMGALHLVATEPRIDVAVLDINLAGEFVFPVADALLKRRVPFIFASGYDGEVVRARYPKIIKCDKPVEMRDLIGVLETLVDVGRAA